MTRAVTIQRFQDGQCLGPTPDEVTLEEPLQIRIEGEPVAVAMRTPGQDEELAAGWTLSEGIVRSASEIAAIVPRPGDATDRAAMVDVMLHDKSQFSAAKHRRALMTNSSCGLCGAATIDQVLRDFRPIDSALRIRPETILKMPAALAAKQGTFRRTGGLHACGLFSADGELIAIREDVGRHNALDKLLGWALLEKRLPLSESIAFLSGRVSFEMVQKTLAAGIPILAAIGAPSSLAVDLARKSGQTLIAFVRGRTMNVYTGSERLGEVGRN